MKKVLLGTLAVLTLAACSKDEVVQQNPNDAISFTATTNKAISRAADGYCNNELPTDFQVWAEVDNKNYFAQERYVRDGETSVYTISGAVRYWPESTTQKINFFAACNKGKGTQSEISIKDWTSATTATPTDKIIEGYTIETTVADQKDLIYAVLANATRPSGPEGKKDINFRHALSQIEFAAVNQNPKIYVEITQVQVVRVNNKGDFKFPTASTDVNVDKHDFSGTYPSVVGSWSGQTGSATYKTTEFSAVKLSQIGYDESTSTYSGTQATASSLTIDDPTSPKHEYNDNTMYLLPQGVTAWDPSDNAKPAEGTGAYFLVKTKIWNVAAGDGHRAAADEIVLWGDAS
ncbi:MAG: fimbrillin family protein, partial [Muribaculaceae bacterium]